MNRILVPVVLCPVAVALAACSSSGSGRLGQDEAVSRCQQAVGDRYSTPHQQLRFDQVSARTDGEKWTIGGTVQGVNATRPAPGQVTTGTVTTEGMPLMRFECGVTSSETAVDRYDYAR